MKNLINSVIFAFAMTFVIAGTASADDKDTLKVTGFESGIYTTKQGKIRIHVDKYNKKPTVILLEDKRGIILYEEVAGKNETKLRRMIDMSQLPTGEYTLKISSNGEKQIKKLGISETLPERLISMN